jgi:hypothetical protein
VSFVFDGGVRFKARSDLICSRLNGSREEILPVLLPGAIGVFRQLDEFDSEVL